MRNRISKPIWSTTRLSAAVGVLFCLVLALNILAVHAQSGRRGQKQPEPLPEASPEPTAKATPRPADGPKTGIILGMNGTDVFANAPLYFYDTVLQSCADRLQESNSVQLDVSGRDMARVDAVKLAKSQRETYVAFLELRTDTRSSNPNYGDFYIEYTVFAPETAKIVTSGHTYQGAYSNRGVVVGPGGTNRSAVYAEQLLKVAARAAADRILGALHIPPPGRGP
jgi:hypothetical protein